MLQTPAAESYTKPARERQGSLIVLIDLPTKPPYTSQSDDNGSFLFALTGLVHHHHAL
ncbi:hypothetical protein KR100_07110 [Synechococcus sp. KORDI-100]|uniref:hypothetical protein n=1 Tax=Synechococcus sp. KORDI-100 TaxID=1280380 RepID=UPI0004E03AEC|nr:hypothetical protein [Synechococcus sp. KORDI-100]AII43134.1 hypothetical protein KR100_07110 [Synechococcus sp. KORDI-100]